MAVIVLFHVNDIFDMLDALHKNNHILEKLHLLVHADDTTILANTRESDLANVKYVTLLGSQISGSGIFPIISIYKFKNDLLLYTNFTTF